MGEFDGAAVGMGQGAMVGRCIGRTLGFGMGLVDGEAVLAIDGRGEGIEGRGVGLVEGAKLGQDEIAELAPL